MREQKEGSVVTENPKGGSLKPLGGFRGGTAHVCLKNEDTGAGDRERHQKLLGGGGHFSEVTFKGGSAKFHLV